MLFLKHLKGLFSRTPFEESEVIITLKVKTWDQKYSALCGYKVTAYYQVLGAFFRKKKIGVIDHQTSFGKYDPSREPNYLFQAEQMLKKLLDVDPKIVNNSRMMVVKVKDLIND